MRVISIAALFFVASGLRAPSSATSEENDVKLQETVRALDTDGNGKIDQSELEAFAKTQGLSSEEVIADFKELDVNHDGALDVQEIGPLFSGASGAADTAPAPASVVQTPAATSPGVAEAAPREAAAPGNILPPPEAVMVPAAPMPPAAAALQSAPVLAATVPAQEQTQPQSTASIDLVSLQKDAQQQAGTVIASRLAQRAQQLLTRSAEDEKKAAAFEEEAQKLRAQAAALAQKAADDTKNAALVASADISTKSKTALDAMNADQRKAEAAAEEKREEARKAMERVRKAQSFLVKA